MLRKFGILLAIVALAVAGLFAYAARLPDTFRVERSTSIKAPADRIFPLINSLSAFHGWEPFSKLDPNIKITYGSPDSGKGANYTWAGNSRVGEGRITLTDSQPPSKVMMQLDMVRPMEAHNAVVFSLTPQGADT